MKQIDFAGKEPIDIIGIINTGEKILDASLPFINGLIETLSDLGKSDNIKTPRGKRIHIERLEAVDKLLIQKDELHDKYFLQLIEKGILEA